MRSTKQEKANYHHIKKLMYTVNVGSPDPRFGNMLLVVKSNKHVGEEGGKSRVKKSA